MTTTTKLTRYALVGTGNRARMFSHPLIEQYHEANELVGLCDINPGRVAYYQQELVSELGYHEVPTYAADDFEKMVRETKPDVVIVTTVDSLHHEYIIRAVELGCDVVTEKPITTDAEKSRAIMDAVQRTGRKVRVTFNVRWGPGPTLVKRLLAEGTIGEVLHVDMQYLLNTNHGADYFRRWHRDKSLSGGLMVHKSTHHFDMINWLVDAVPDTVFGMGRLAFYGRENAEKRGERDKTAYERYTGHTTVDKDPFALVLDNDDRLRQFYLENEKYDGYQRDRNVFGEGITIEDSMSVLVKYRTGATLNYSLNAYVPREGYQVAINGTKGRIEFSEQYSVHTLTGSDPDELASKFHWETRCVVLPMFGDPYEVAIPKAEGTHGGADPLIQEQIFSPTAPDEVYGRNAGHEQGIASALIGIAANQCFETGQPVQIADLCPQLPRKARLSELT